MVRSKFKFLFFGKCNVKNKNIGNGPNFLIKAIENFKKDNDPNVLTQQ